MLKRQRTDDVVMGLPCTLVLVLIFGAVLLFQPFVDCREFRLSATCYSDTLHLDCGKSVIAIHEAYFTSAKQENHTCRSPAPPEDDYIEDNADADIANDSICREDIRVALNRKCSGFKSCNFSYSQQPEKSCYSPEGLSVVRFDCVRESTINKYCNSKITSQEGYIASPGYPQYYPQLHSCSWTLSASDGQSILASVLHLHLREATEATPTMTSPELDFHVMGQMVEEAVRRCDDDWLRLVEGVVKKAEVCGEGEEGLREVEAEGGIEVRFRSAAFMPASGFLLHYKVQGCPTLPPGEDSYLLARNGSYAVYGCRRPHQVFNDTLEATRYLTCVRDHHWNDTLPHCIALDDTSSSITVTTLSSVDAEKDINNSTMTDHEKTSSQVVDHKAHLVEDIIIPCVIIAVLLIVNGIVLIVIFAIRRRQKPIEAEFEGLSEGPPIVSEEKFEEESPQISLNEGESKPTVSKKATEQSPQTSLKENQPQPTVSQEAKGSDSPPPVSQDAKGYSQPTVSKDAKGSDSQSQEAEGIDSHQTLSQLLETLSSSKESLES